MEGVSIDVQGSSADDACMTPGSAGYSDDEGRWEELANLSPGGGVACEYMPLAEAIDVSPGQVRLSGHFRGLATTHTHQLDLAVGLDVELPSEVAAELTKQIAHRSRSSSPLHLRNATPEPPAPPPSFWNSLHSFFRKDARQARGRAAQQGPALRDASRSKSKDRNLHIKIKDAADYGFDNKQLREDLDASNLRIAALEDEKAQLELRLQTVIDENVNQSAEVVRLRTALGEVEEQRTRSGNETESACQRLLSFEGQLNDSRRQNSELEASLADVSARCAALEEESRELGRQNAEIRSERSHWQTRAAQLEANVNLLEQRTASGSDGEARQAEAVVDKIFAELEAARVRADQAEAAAAEASRRATEQEAGFRGRESTIARHLEEASRHGAAQLEKADEDRRSLAGKLRQAEESSSCAKAELSAARAREQQLQEQCARLEAYVRLASGSFIDGQKGGTCFIRAHGLADGDNVASPTRFGSTAAPLLLGSTAVSDACAESVGSASVRKSRSAGASGTARAAPVRHTLWPPPVVPSTSSGNVFAAPCIPSSFSASSGVAYKTSAPTLTSSSLHAPTLSSSALQLSAPSLNGSTYIGSTIHTPAGPVRTRLNVQVLGVRRIVR